MNTPLPALWQEQEDSKAAQLDIRQMLLSVYAHKWPILALGLLTGIIAFLYANTLVPMYQARATLLIEINTPNIVSIQDVYTPAYRGWDYYQTQIQLLHSRGLAERVVRELELHKDPRFAQPDPDSATKSSRLPSWLNLAFLSPPGRADNPRPEAQTQEQREASHIEQLASMIANGISVAPLGDGLIVAITYRSDDPVLAANIVNTLADQFIESDLDARLGATRRATEWLAERLESLRVTLQQSEQRLQAFTEEERLVDLEGITTLGARQIADLTERHSEAVEKRMIAENIRREVQRIGGGTTDQYLSLPAVQRHDVISTLRQMQADAQRRVNELGQRYGVRHPRMIAANSELESIQADMRGEVNKVIAGIDAEYQLALRTEETLFNQLEAAKEEFRDVSRKNFELRELQREVETNRQLYDLFFTRMQETSQTAGIDRPNARVVDSAQPPAGPISPNKRMIVVVGLLGGLLVGAGSAVLHGVLDNTVKTPADVEAKLHARVLGVLPVLEPNKNGFLEPYWQNSRSGYAEAVRTIRTSVVLSGLDNPHKIVVITSALPSEGKSTVSLNLAAAFSQMEKTLLVGADMRRPTLASKCGISPRHAGLSNYVAGNIALEECIVQIGDQDLWVMPSGLIPANPLELLSSQKFRDALDELNNRFDRIIIDSAPVHSVSDALILATYADTLLYVVKADATSATVSRRGLERLASASTPVSGVILNSFDEGKAAKYYGKDEYAQYTSYYGANDESPRQQ